MNTLAEIEAARDDALEQLTERHANKLVTRKAYAAMRQLIQGAFTDASNRLLAAPQTRETAPAVMMAPEPEKALPAPSPQPTRTVEITYNGVRHTRRVDANGQIMAEPFITSDGRDRPTSTGG